MAKRQCLEFARSFQAKIPTELRETVYTHVWNKTTLESMFDDVREDTFVTDFMLSHAAPTDTELYPHGDWKRPGLLKCSGDCCDCFMWWELPLWVQHQFVGFEVAREVATAYYRIGPSKRFSYQKNLRAILLKDLFHLGIKPADHLRRLEIDLDGYNTHAQVVALEKQLPSLLELRLKKGFDLVLKTRLLSQPRKTLHVLDKMVPVVTELKQAGANVCASSTVRPYEFRPNVPNILILTSEQWTPTWRATLENKVLDKKREYANPANDLERALLELWAGVERSLDAPEWTDVAMISDATSDSSNTDSASDEE
jgi:hypothetical protein